MERGRKYRARCQHSRIDARRPLKRKGKATLTRRLINIQDVAEYTGLSVHTLYAMVSQRRIPFVKMGRRTMFDREELDRWIAKNSVMPIAGKRP